MGADGGRTASFVPELKAFGLGFGNEAFAVAFGADGDDALSDFVQGGFIIPDDVAHEHHLGILTAAAFDWVIDGVQIPVVQVFETGQHASLGVRIEKLRDFDDGGTREPRSAEKFQTHGARKRRHLVQNPSGGGDKTVAAFLLNAWESPQAFVGDVFAETFFTEGSTGHFQDVGMKHPSFFRIPFVTVLEGDFPDDFFLFVNLAEIVVDTDDLKPVAVRVDHAESGEIVDGCAPEDGFFAAGIFADVAPHGTCVGACGIDRKHESVQGGRFRHTARDGTGTGVDDRGGGCVSRQHFVMGAAYEIHFFRIDDDAHRRHRYGAPGVSRTAAAGNDDEPQFHGVAHQVRNLAFAVRSEDGERKFHAPVGGVGDVAGTGKSVKTDVVFVGMAFEAF